MEMEPAQSHSRARSTCSSGHRLLAVRDHGMFPSVLARCRSEQNPPGPTCINQSSTSLRRTDNPNIHPSRYRWLHAALAQNVTGCGAWAVGGGGSRRMDWATNTGRFLDSTQEEIPSQPASQPLPVCPLNVTSQESVSVCVRADSCVLRTTPPPGGRLSITRHAALHIDRCYYTPEPGSRSVA